MKRTVSALIIFVFVGQSWASVGLKISSGLWPEAKASQTLLQVAEAEESPGLRPSMFEGVRDGRSAAERRPSGATFFGGAVCGLLAGLICTGILWAVTGPDQVPIIHQKKAMEKGDEYFEGFVNGYEERTKAKKRSARLGGGLAGTAVFVILYLSATSD